MPRESPWTEERAMQETRVRSLGQEDPLEKRMVTHSSILAWRIPWTDHGVTKSQTTTEPLTLSLHFFFQKGK